MAAGCELCSQPKEGCFELSVGNPDKGLLPLDVVRRRVQQFVDTNTPVVVTQVCASLFASSKCRSILAAALLD